MNKTLTIEELPYDPELARLFAEAERNLLWFDEHVEELEIYKRYRGRYVAAIDGELLVAATPPEIDRLICAKQPDGLAIAHVRYIPREKSLRIYAC